MKTVLYGTAAVLIFGMALATDSVEAQYGLLTWFIGAVASLGAAGLMILVANLLPDKPRHRRHRRKEGEYYAQRRA